MLEALLAAQAKVDSVLSRIDPALLHAPDAARIFDAAETLVRKASALRTLVAARAADAGEWSRVGYRSPEDWYAQATGTSYPEAANTLDASLKLKDLPQTKDALRKGELSAPQIAQLGPAATPENESKLLDDVRSGGLTKLKRSCQQEKAKALTDEQARARHERIIRERSWRCSTDPDGTWRSEANGPNDKGAEMAALITAEAERLFRAANRDGQRQSAANYRFDALFNLITGGGGAVKTEVVIRVAEARLRGDAGLCETEAGPVPVDVAIGAILAGAFVKVVVTDGVDISTVAHLDSRHIPALLRTAVVERDGNRCVRPGCDSAHRLETHHYTVDYRDHGETSYANLATLCKTDHDLVTNKGHRLRGGPGRWQWIPPP